VLGLDPETSVDVQQPLRDLGLDSLMAVELRNALAEALDRTLPATLLFRHPTLDALCAFILAQVPGASPDEGKAAPPVGPAEDDLAVATLSDEDARQLLADELSSLSASAWVVDGS
jgi:acyl carrier protein